MVMRRREFLTLASTLGASLALGGPALAAGEPRPGGTLKIRMKLPEGKDPRSYDWHEVANVSRGWLEYLVRYRRDGVIEPQLLESWTVSPDARTYVLKLRPGVVWNNGDDFTASDVAFNFNRWCDQTAQANFMAFRLSALVDSTTRKAAKGAIETPDRLTVRLNLLKPDVTLLATLSEFPAAVMHPSWVDGDPFAGSIGTGPYILDSWKPGVNAVLVRNRRHRWRNEGNGAWLDRIEFVDISDEDTALAALVSGEIDMLDTTPTDFVREQELKSFSLSEVLTASTLVFRFNVEAEVNGKRIYADRRVRQALSLACDNAVVTELAMKGLAMPAENHHVCPIHPDYAPLPPLASDKGKALGLLREAGMADVEHELISVDVDWISRSSDVVADEMRAAGIKIKRTTLPGSTFWNDWTKYPFSATNWNMRPFATQILGLAYRTDEAWNETRFSSRRFDALLDEANAIFDPVKRSSLVAEMETILQQEAVIIQPYWLTLYRHAHPRVRGAEVHPLNEIHLDRIWIES